MKLYHSILEKPIEFAENEINIVVVEDQKIMSSLINELVTQLNGLDGEFVLSNNNNIVELSKNCDLIINYFDLNLNSKKILSKLFGILSNDAMSEGFYQNTLELKSKIFDYIENLVCLNKYNVVYAHDFELNTLLKLVDVNIDSNSSTLFEKLIDYLTVMIELININCFIFINIKSFLNKNEMIELYKYLNYNKINVLLLENRIVSKLNHENYIILDDDICII